VPLARKLLSTDTVFLISDFRALRPRHSATQAETLEWLACVHARAEARQLTEKGEPADEASLRDSMRRRLTRFGCNASQIATRGHEIDDCSHTRWSEMQVYDFSEQGAPQGMRARTKLFERIATEAFSTLFSEVERPPRDLIHVTCTGYAAPSAAQLLVAAKSWGAETRVTHAYHMGCYAALPALRMAAGFGALGALSAGSRDAEARTDIVHTELCSLHMNPFRHEPEQLVIQSLFADGCIAYSVYPEAQFHGRQAGLAVLALDEWIIPDSAESMAWFCSDSGMEMVLARDVPERIAGSLQPFVASLLEQAGLSMAAVPQAVFAIHPGGPKIVDQIAKLLQLSEEQIRFSRAVLRERGNMSSATLPFIWQKIALASDVPSFTPIVSLAFGPGLTLSGAVLSKVSP